MCVSRWVHGVGALMGGVGSGVVRLFSRGGGQSTHKFPKFCKV